MGRSWLIASLAIVLCVASPAAVLALQFGHPEDLLGAVLCVAAVLAASRERPLVAGLLLGLAVANKEWGVLAAGPVVVALPSGRARALLAAAAVAGAVLAPLVLFGGGFSASVASSAGSGALNSPFTFWWLLGAAGPHGGRLPIGLVQQLAHPLIAVLTVPLAGLCLWRRRSGGAVATHEGLLLLALLFLLRCALDPWDTQYYPLPFLLALLAWETLTQERLPVLALLGTLAAWVLMHTLISAGRLSYDELSVLFLLLTWPAVLALSGAVYFPGAVTRAIGRVGLSQRQLRPARAR
jgi:hypothetical protein